MARPRPVPPPLSLVVKNGSKIRSRNPVRSRPESATCRLPFRLPGWWRSGGTRGRHGVHGIGQEVENDLLHLMAVRSNRRKVGVRGEFTRDILRGEHGAIRSATPWTTAFNRSVPGEAPRPRGRQETLDSGHEPLNLAVNRDQASPILVGQPLTSLQ